MLASTTARSSLLDSLSAEGHRVPETGRGLALKAVTDKIAKTVTQCLIAMLTG